jgi:hypothetical protein
MAVSNTETRQTYTGDGSETDFAIPFDFTSDSTIHVYLIDEDDVETEWTVGAEYALVNSPPTLVRAAVAPTATETLRVERVTPRTQSVEYSGATFPAATVEENEDNITRQIQELTDDIADLEALVVSPSTSSTSTAVIPDWLTDTAYTVGMVVTYNEYVYRCLVAHTSVSFETV